MARRVISRKSFLQQTAALSGAALLADFGVASAISAAPSHAPWFDRPMRWAQLTLVENDPGQYDLKFWLDYFRRVHADAACLSAGGCVAYYPTKIPFHYRSAWMNESDSFGDLLAGWAWSQLRGRTLTPRIRMSTKNTPIGSLLMSRVGHGGTGRTPTSG